MESDLAIKIKDIIALQLAIDRNGGPSGCGHLFEQYHNKRAKIMADFGLPRNLVYENIFFVKSQPTDEDIQAIINRLKEAAADFLLSSPKSDMQLLKEAVESRLAPNLVFSELGITSHIYNYFVYNNILLVQKDSPKSVLNAFNSANDLDTLGLLGRLASTKENSEQKGEIINQLNKRNISYIDDFVAFNQQSD